jgi:15-cis-phytoene synthase
MAEGFESDIQIALNYVPGAIRNDCATVFALDARLGDLVASTREAQLGVIRLAWWRDAVAAYQDHVDHPDPDLHKIARVAQRHRIDSECLSSIAEGWMAIAGGNDRDALANYARARGDGLFQSLAHVMGVNVPEGCGSRYALISFAWRCAQDDLRKAAIDLASDQIDITLPKACRSLALLDHWAKSDIALLRAGSPRPSARWRAATALLFAFLRR